MGDQAKPLPLNLGVLVSLSANAIRIFGWILVLPLITQKLSPREQGLFYAFQSLSTIQSIVVLGFGFIILQQSARILKKSNSTTEELLNNTEFAKLLSFASSWYIGIISIAIVVLFVYGKLILGSITSQTEYFAWIVFGIGALIQTISNGFQNLTEGIGNVFYVACLNLFTSIVSIGSLAFFLITDFGIWAQSLSMIIGATSMLCAYIYVNRKITTLLRPNLNWIHDRTWMQSIIKFQAKMALSTVAAFFAFNTFIPAILRIRGPEEAGKYGLALQICNSLSGIAITTMTYHRNKWGVLAATARVNQLLSEMSRVLLVVVTLFSISFFSVGLFLYSSTQTVIPQHRIPAIPVFLLIGLAALFQAASNVLGQAARSFSDEPMLPVSIAYAGIMFLGVFLAIPHGHAAAWQMSSSLFMLIGGTAIFFPYMNKQREK